MSIFQKIRKSPQAKPVFNLLRSKLRLPQSIYQHLHFVGEFIIDIDSDHRFKMLHVGGAEENRLFWTGFGGEYEPVSLEIWRRLCPHSKVIIDVGAHHGLYSLAAFALNPNAKIIAFEASERCFRVMNDNFRINKFSITSENLAVSNSSGKATFYDLPEDQAVSASLDDEVARLRPDSIPIEVPTVRLDEYLKERRLGPPDLVKLDVERHEPAVLVGMGEMLSKSRPSILIEILNQGVATQVEAALHGLGYVFYLVDEEERTVELVDNLSPRAVVGQNFFVCRPEIASAYEIGRIRL